MGGVPLHPGPGRALRLNVPDKGRPGTGGWLLSTTSGPASALHAASAATLKQLRPPRTARFLAATAPALVLGHHQPESMFDPAALSRAGLEVARRQSGGSAVLVGPGEAVWLDLVVPAGDPLWDDDVARAAWWVGELWASALEAVGAGPASVWTGPMRRHPWSPLVCFAGLAAGEVTVGGAKAVGVSQRRTARGALFQTAAVLTWDPGRYRELLAGPAPPGEPPPVSAVGAQRAAALEQALAERLVP